MVSYFLYFWSWNREYITISIVQWTSYIREKLIINNKLKRTIIYWWWQYSFGKKLNTYFGYFTEIITWTITLSGRKNKIRLSFIKQGILNQILQALCANQLDWHQAGMRFPRCTCQDHMIWLFSSMNTR